MESVSLQNSSMVCDNSLMNAEVGNRSSIVCESNSSKSTFRTKNGLVNGVGEDKPNCSKNHSEINLLQNEDMGKSISDVPNNQHDQSYTHNCTENAPLQLSESNLNHNSDISQTNQNNSSSESSNLKSKGKRKKQTKVNNNIDKCLEIDEEIGKPATDSGVDTNVIRKPFVCDRDLSGMPCTSSSLNCTMNISESENDFIIHMHKLELEDPKAKSCKSKKTVPVVAELSAAEETPDLREITYVQYESELQMPFIMKIIQKDLSEPYSIYTYRYFIHNWPKLCFLAMCEDICVGAIVCKLDYHRKSTKRGYIAMLAVDQHYRNRKIGSTLVKRAIKEMIAGNADEVVLETEVTNKPALRLYELLGFVRDKRLFRYYLNGVDALRLKLWLR